MGPSAYKSLLSPSLVVLEEEGNCRRFSPIYVACHLTNEPQLGGRLALCPSPLSKVARSDSGSIWDFGYGAGRLCEWRQEILRVMPSFHIGGRGVKGKSAEPHILLLSVSVWGGWGGGSKAKAKLPWAAKPSISLVSGSSGRVQKELCSLLPLATLG